MQEIINKLLSEMEDDICELQNSTQRADVMANDIAEEYFDTDISDTNGKTQICFYFDSTRIKHDILFDYIKNISQQTEKLNIIWRKMHELTSRTNNIGGNLQ